MSKLPSDDRLPPLATLRAFEAAARHVSFSRAASELNITPAAVSHQIKALEQRLAIPLFERLPNGLELTRSGRDYRVAVADALSTLARATGRLNAPALEGPLRIATTQSFALFWLVPRLATFAANHPGIDLTLHADSRHVDVGTGLMDVAIRLGSGSYPGLQSSLLMNDAVLPVAGFSLHERVRATSLTEVLQQATLLEDYTIGSNEPFMAWSQWLRQLKVRRRPPDRRLQFSDSGLATQACLFGAGIGLARLSFVQHAMAANQLYALSGAHMTEFAHYVVIHPADEANPRVIAFCTWLREEVENYLDQLEPLMRRVIAP